MSENIKNKKIAVVLFNLGGPDSQDAVKPFLFNLFNDKKIINLPSFFRYFIAKIIANTRENKAKAIYAKIGGKSPIFEETKNQADALFELLNSASSKSEKADFEIFISMRHWHPMSDSVISKLEIYQPDQIILLPLYPQFSITTTGSSIEDFQAKLKKSLKLKKITCKTICCYPTDANFLAAHANTIQDIINSIPKSEKFRILFSAHGLPQKIIDSGDPYQYQVEQTVKGVVQLLSASNLDYKITYQSRVGPLKWIGPNTEDEINNAGAEKIGLVIVPIAFVSEHSETLVELDIEYKEIADKYTINYYRVPTLSVNKLFIKSLADVIIRALKNDEKESVYSSTMTKICPKNYKKCPCNLESIK